MDKRVNAIQNILFLLSLKCLTNNLRFVVGHHLVEDVVASLIGQLEAHSGLLQQVCEKHENNLSLK